MLNYTTFVNSYANMLVVPSTDARFQVYLPNAIDYAEQRLYRELQLLNTVVSDGTASFTAGNRNFTLPTTNGTFIVVERINVVTTPNGVTTQNPLTPMSKEALDFIWPSSVGSTVPQYFAMQTQAAIVVGPVPDQAYQVVVNGTQRPTPLSSGNTTTLLSVYFPDLFLTAACIWGAGALKNFGAAQGPDDPGSGVTWESQYGRLMQSAKTEEDMKKFTAAGWSSKASAPTATPPRT